MTTPITDGESGLSVRTKLNQTIGYADNYTQGVINPYRFAGAAAKLQKIDRPAEGSPYFGVVAYGDSMAGYSRAFGDFANAMIGKYGFGGFFTPNLGLTWTAAAWTLTGGAAVASIDYTYLPGSGQITIPSGGDATISTPDSGFSNKSSATIEGTYLNESLSSDFAAPLKTVRVFYFTRPGDGSLTITLSQTAASYTPVVINCDAALGLSYQDIAVVDQSAPVELELAASGGTVLSMGAAFLRESGVLFQASQVGGSTMDNQNAYISGGETSVIFQDLMDGISAGLILHSQRAYLDGDIEGNYIELFDALDTSHPDITQVVMGEAPRIDTVGNDTVIATNAILLRESLARGYVYIDQYHLMGGSYAAMVALGFDPAGDVHLTYQANRYLGGVLYKALSDGLATAANQSEYQPLTRYDLGRNWVRIQTEQAASSLIFNGDWDSGATSGSGYAATNSVERGYQLTAGANLGHAVGRIGAIPGNPYVNLADNIMGVSGVGYRSMDINSGHTAWIIVGVTTAPTSISSLSLSSFGVEFALGSDVGSPDGATGEVARIFAYDGTTLHHSRWVQIVTTGAASAYGVSFGIIYDQILNRIDLYAAEGRSGARNVKTSLNVTMPTSLSGQWIAAGIAGEDGGNVPASTSRMEWINVSARWDQINIDTPTAGWMLYL